MHLSMDVIEVGLSEGLVFQVEREINFRDIKMR